MLLILIWIYIFIVTFLVLFLILWKLKIDKFKNLNSSFPKISNIFFVLMIIFTIIWFGIIFYINFSFTQSVNPSQVQESVYY